MSDDFSKEKRVPSRSSTLVSATFADTTEIRAPSESNDAIIVDWDGPDDPANPKNWPYRQKWAATLVVSLFTFISPVSSSMVAPATTQVAADFGVTDTVIIAMMTSIFVLAYAIGPLFLGPLSEIYGRSRVLQLSNVFYLGMHNSVSKISHLILTGYRQFGILRAALPKRRANSLLLDFLLGWEAAHHYRLVVGVLGDVWRAEERGKATAIYSLAPLLGPVVGPVCGAWIAEKSRWRWVFWSTSIVDAAIQISGFFFLQETFAPLLLERKAKLIRKSLDAEEGQAKDVRTIYEEKGERSWSQILSKALTRPFLIFGREFIVQLLGIYMAFVYGVFYLFLTNVPSIFEGQYHERTGIAGLNYISLGLGIVLGSQISARYMDRIYKYYKAQNNGVGEPEFRLPSMVPGTFILPAGLLLVGWSAEKKVHSFFTDFVIFLVGGGMVPLFQAIQTYVVDAFTLHAASALAAVSCLRSLAGFGFPLFAPNMFKTLGYGKGNTILAVVSIVLGCPVPWLFWKYGKRIRLASQYTTEKE
ncbi:Efflux pump vrtL [Hypsizygus marmoreus]|uniref:Efflux pump vrtL n=1 Tax=Hypsizygus marmoreus TaxID=39966 RepID=A0A369J3M3_HYPMA|nr:Efflux pump vrtL [Hypsizygus marmoreus]